MTKRRTSPRGSDGAAVVSRVVLGAALIAAAVYGVALLRHDPAPWPDEALFANPAVSLLRHGHLGTDVMAGYLPHIAERTYWMPPLYFVVLAPWFAVFGVGLGAMRAFSLVAGAAALVLTWRLARRAGLPEHAANIAVALLAVDGVFLRAARVGRMDVLALALALAAVERLLAARTGAPRAAFAAGLLAALATTTHPLAGAALAVVGADLSLRRDVPSLRAAAKGAAAPLGLWGLYIFRDPSSFVAQFGAQLARKASRHPWSFASMRSSLTMNLDQYRDASNPSVVDPHAAAVALWCVGTVGLVWGALRSPSLRPVLALHAALGLAVLTSMEMWYPVYVLPTVALGAAALLADVTVRGARRTVVAVVVLGVGATFGVRSLTRQQALLERWSELGTDGDYDAFCTRVGALIPRGATVFVSVLPDVTLGLLGRDDLRLRTFVPEGLPVAPAAVRAGLDDATVIVTGPWAPGTVADVVGPQRGRLLGLVGNSPEGYQARVWAMPARGAP